MATKLTTAPPNGSQVDVLATNCKVIQANPDGTWILVQASGGDPLNPLQFWVPVNSGQFTVSQSLPVSWPPIANDMWYVPGVSHPAFVVSGGGTVLYFCQGTDIITLVTSAGKTLPLTTDAALGLFGSALVLLYRPTVT
jgi:hypothetical protein